MAPPLPSTTSVLPADPVIVTPLTRSAERVELEPPDEIEISPPDEVIVTGSPPEADAAHASRNVIAVASLVSVPPAASMDAVTLTAPALAFVTWTAHLPSAPVVHV